MEYSSIGRSTMDAVRRAVRTRGRRVLLGVTLSLGVLAAVGVAAGSDPAERTLAALADPVQTLMSVVVPSGSTWVMRRWSHSGS